MEAPDKMISVYKIVSGYKKDDLERKIRSIEHGIEARERTHKEVESSRILWTPSNKANADSTHATMMARSRAALEVWRKQTPIEDKIIKYSSQGLSLQGGAVPLPLVRGEIFHRYEQTMVK